jgi:hypothetical protein
MPQTAEDSAPESADRDNRERAEILAVSQTVRGKKWLVIDTAGACAETAGITAAADGF